MQFFKREFSKCILFLSLILILDAIVGFLLQPVAYYGYYANKDMKNAAGTIDTVFLGSSWTYLDYNCKQYDEVMGTVSFNAGSSGQTIIDSYFYLNEILKENPVKTVYFNIHHLKLQNPKSRYSSPVVNDRLTGLNRIKHIMASSDINIVQYFMKSYRYRDNLSIANISNNVQKKLSQEYKNGVWFERVDGQSYDSMGYIFSDLQLKQGNNEKFTAVDSTWKIFDIKEDNVKYFSKIISLCKKENINLILITPPFTRGFLQSTLGYNEFANYMDGVAKENNLEYIDFNRLKNTPFWKDNLFTDTTHLNTEGAKVLTSLLCQFRNQSRKLDFWERYNERLDLYDICGGVKLKAEKYNDNILLQAKAANETDMKVLYRYKKLNKDTNEWEILDDYSSKNTIVIDNVDEKNEEYRVECKNLNSLQDFDAYSEAIVESGAEDEIWFTCDYILENKTIVLRAGMNSDTLEYQFSKWLPDGTFEILQKYSNINRCDVPIPVDGMYLYKVQVRDSLSKENVGEKQYFIDTNQYREEEKIQ